MLSTCTGKVQIKKCKGSDDVGWKTRITFLISRTLYLQPQAGLVGVERGEQSSELYTAGAKPI